MQEYVWMPLLDRRHGGQHLKQHYPEMHRNHNHPPLYIGLGIQTLQIPT